MSDKKKTLIIGASPDRSRYSYLVTSLLSSMGHEVVALGKRMGEINSIPITQDFPLGAEFDTVTLYLNPTHQQEYYEDIIALKPLRVIFNPGTENDEFYKLLNKANIKYEEACTLVLLKTGRY